MTQEHPSKLTLTVEESVWLNKGQEIEEILGMSLSPEITIKESGNQVSIVGGLRLVGEYLLADSDQATEQEIDDEDGYREQASFRSIEEVNVSENGKGDLKHFFPIDVTIPLDRIQNLQDIYVEVESFDYDVPDKSCIQLTADISISGMTTQDEPARRVEAQEAVQEDAEVEQEEQAVDTSFAYEAYQLPTPAPAISEEEEVDEEVVRAEVEEDIEVETEVVYADDDATVSELQRITLAPKQPEVYAEENNRNDAYYEDQQDPQSEEEQAQQPAYQATEEREENALYLTGMMAKSEEQFTRVKMCIIQEDESLDTIANRYDVSTSQLIRTNRLEADHVEAGQILYIPVQS
ncbi:stage VI sporulation protein D [Alkalicoccobacillus gibsonii]|uniref:stage VI sporulation protein D n=1 Tax=Alkalicoccobacillus gibsonii TaxID=79881 RepID=UPI0019346B58|nr:stage VI sporulation protein D [Alkalicoccobacillus gibsonii]MBM0067207.1 stage VI sporulation protein D [Alkalicoccobacillus gibsonii]